MAIKIIQVDAFTSVPFSGNPAAVCLLDRPRDDGWMQRVASEMNLSETAFLTPAGDGGGRVEGGRGSEARGYAGVGIGANGRDESCFGLRWFAPKAEVDLCGHATLASAHVLWEERILPPGETARFDTKSGTLTAERVGGLIEMDFPAEPERPVKCSPPMLGAALGAPSSYVGDNRFDLLVELDGEETLRDLRPNFDLLKKIPVRGVMVTAESDSPEYDFVSRFFAPALGVDEDPVTGSAHCCLGPYWARRLGRNELVGYQASKRGGVVRVRVGEDGERVKIGGEAVTVLKGELLGG
ncbi:MAG: PhzF family phenazine biosynthesis protein [Methanothrix sp.]